MTALPKTYVPLWCKSNYSFLEGASSPEDYVKTAYELGLNTLALTDRNGMYGAVRALAAKSEFEVRTILGSELSLEKGESIILLAKTQSGYANLCGLASKAHFGRPKNEACLSLDDIIPHTKDLIALWPSPKPDTIAKLKEAFGKNLYLPISRHFRIDDSRHEAAMRSLARQFDVDLVAVNEVLYHDAKRRPLQDVLTCIKKGIRLHEAGNTLRENDEHGLLSPEHFIRRFHDAPELIQNTLFIAEACQFGLSDIKYQYPVEASPDGLSTDAWLRKLTFEGASKRYGGRVPKRVVDQLDKELLIIEQLQYSGYFLTMYELVQFCASREIICQGRGSAANSAVCFCLGVTAIDPVHMDLLFERFLSLERAEPPDIDLDIEHNRREEVIQHMYEKYGREKAAMVANVVRYRSRSAIRDVGKVFGFSEVTLDRCAKLMPHFRGDFGSNLIDAGLDFNSALVKQFLELSHAIRGFPRHLSIHPGGFLLSSEPISTIVPIEPATMPNRTVIQWDKEDIETLNLFKVDLLGLGALTHLDYCFRLLKKHYRKDLSMATIPPDDEKTYIDIRRADTVGVFQIESRAQMAMLPRLKPQNYYDLVIEISLIRPGPITGGMVHPYLRRRAGEEAISYPHINLEPVLKKTLGIPLFQEQVMKLAMVAADYSPGEADQLRRDMAAWKSTGRIERHQEKLISRMVAKGIEEEFAKRVFEQIKGFGEYGFPESHAASFALIAYATAYLKSHYPAVFTCGLLNALPMGFYSSASIIEDAKRHRVQILPINVLVSQWDCDLEQVKGDRKYSIRVGLKFLSGISKADYEAIEKARSAQPIRSLGQFKAVCKLPRDVIEDLAQSGAFECFGVARRSALWAVLDRAMNQYNEDLLPYVEGRAKLRRLSGSDEIIWDYETTDMSTRGHLVSSFREILDAQGLFTADKVNAMKHQSQVRFAGQAICRQMPENANGVMFMTLEDETGFINLIVWEQAFKLYRNIILTNWFLGVTGTLQVEGEVKHLVAQSFWVPDITKKAGSIKTASHDFH